MAEFQERFAQRPQIIVCNVEFLSSKKVAKGFIVILKLQGRDPRLVALTQQEATNSLY